jgi:hypothetical protein
MLKLLSDQLQAIKHLVGHLDLSGWLFFALFLLESLVVMVRRGMDQLNFQAIKKAAHGRFFINKYEREF